MPDENKNNDPESQDEVGAAANRFASDGGGEAGEPDASPDAKPDEAAGDTTAPPVTDAQSESDSSLDAADARSQDDVDGALADAGTDVPTFQPGSPPHDESPIDETDASDSDSEDEQDLVHQADARPLDMPDLESTQAAAEANAASIELLRDVELGVTIELGRCRMYVEDVLKLDQGAVVELDKLAGDPVDVYVNERLIARGEVLVLNDNFCVRINEIVAPVQEAETA